MTQLQGDTYEYSRYSVAGHFFPPPSPKREPLIEDIEELEIMAGKLAVEKYKAHQKRLSKRFRQHRQKRKDHVQMMRYRHYVEGHDAPSQAPDPLISSLASDFPSIPHQEIRKILWGQNPKVTILNNKPFLTGKGHANLTECITEFQSHNLIVCIWP
jgi:hypothetical protein